MEYENLTLKQIKDTLACADDGIETEILRSNVVGALYELFLELSTIDERPISIKDAELILLSPGVVAERHILPELQKYFSELPRDEVWKIACKKAGEIRKDVKAQLCNLLSDAEDFEESIKTSKNRRANKAG
ncbi:hypothetical protein [Escherichia coli]|uniref:hypothetical protein n=1 Tax=Escherichia coli TaxID=562 RepID=UPI0037DCD4AA